MSKPKLTDIRAFLIRTPPAVPPVWGDEEMEAKRQRSLEIIGEKWLLHPKHSPKKADYNGWPK